MGAHFGFRRLTASGGGEFTLTATTTGAGQTVTLDRLTVNVPGLLLNWGDGSFETLPRASTAALTHVYASAGTYRIVLANAAAITQLQLTDAQLSGLNTAQLAQSRLGHFYVSGIGICTINSSHMSAWRPSWFLLSYMATGGSYNINTAHMTDWRPSLWYLIGMPAGIYTFAAACLRNWTAINEIQCLNLGLNAAAVDTILADLYAGGAGFTYATPALNVGGSNAAPTGTYQNADPPTTGMEYMWELVNTFTKKWTVTYNGGVKP